MYILIYIYIYICFFRQNQTHEQKDADVKRRSNRRAAEKEERAAKKLAQTNEDWIIHFINTLALDIPIQSEKRKYRLANQRIRQQKLRDGWTEEERKNYNATKNDYQKQVRNSAKTERSTMTSSKKSPARSSMTQSKLSLQGSGSLAKSKASSSLKGSLVQSMSSSQGSSKSIERVQIFLCPLPFVFTTLPFLIHISFLWSDWK